MTNMKGTFRHTIGNISVTFNMNTFEKSQPMVDTSILGAALDPLSSLSELSEISFL